MEMLRRLLLVGLFCFTPTRGSLAQLTSGALLCIVYLFVQMQASPFKETSDDYAAKVSSFFLAMYFSCCVIFKVQEHLQQPEVQALRSDSQDELVSLPYLSEVTISSVVGAVVFTAAIVTLQIRVERARRLHEQLLCKSRRLRYKETNEEVQAPTLPLLMSYHVFLSHVWGTVCLLRSNERLIVPRWAADHTLLKSYWSRAKTKCGSSSRDCARWW
jgi:hypothetical protein